MSFLNSLFGPSRDDVWSTFAAEIGGTHTAGGWFESSKVELDAGPWTITLDVFTENKATYTRLRVPYRNPTRFGFDVSPQHFLSGMCRLFGMQDIAIGVPAFDEKWVLKGTNEDRVRRLFQNESIRSLLAGAGPVTVKVLHGGWFGPRLPEGVAMLQLTTRGVVKDTDRLKVFFALFAETLDRLVASGDATRTPPGV